MKVPDENDQLKAGTLPKDAFAGVEPARKPGLRIVAAEEKTGDPADVVAERGLLGSLLWCAANAPELVSLATIRDLIDAPEQFYDTKHQAIFATMTALALEGKAVDVISVNGTLSRECKDRAAGGLAYIERLVTEAETASPQKARTWAELIRDAHGRRLLVATSQIIADKARRGAASAIELAQFGLARLADDSAKMSAGEAGLIPMKTAAANVLRAALAGRGNYVPSGICDLDAIIGGLFAEDVTLLAGATSVGKSVLSMQIATSIVRTDETLSVLYVTLETSSGDFARRVMCSMAGVDLQRLRMGAITSTEANRIVTASTEIAKLNIEFSDGSGQSIMDVHAKAERLQRRLMREGKRVALIVIDTIGLVKPSAIVKKKGNEQEQIAETSKGLRYLAKEHSCHVLGLHHINREAVKRQGKARLPRREDLRGSGATENDADNVFLLHQDSDHKGMPIPDAPVACLVAKARNGSKGLALLQPDLAHGRFTEWKGDPDYYD